MGLSLFINKAFGATFRSYCNEQRIESGTFYFTNICCTWMNITYPRAHRPSISQQTECNLHTSDTRHHSITEEQSAYRIVSDLKYDLMPVQAESQIYDTISTVQRELASNQGPLLYVIGPMTRWSTVNVCRRRRSQTYMSIDRYRYVCL